MLYAAINYAKFTDAEIAFLTSFADLPYANGDVLYYNSGQLRRLPKGTDGQVLTLASGLPSWAGVTAGGVVFGGPSGALQQDAANLFYDDTNNRLGIGTASPAATLDVSGSFRLAGRQTSAYAPAYDLSTNTLATSNYFPLGTVTVPDSKKWYINDVEGTNDSVSGIIRAFSWDLVAGASTTGDSVRGAIGRVASSGASNVKSVHGTAEGLTGHSGVLVGVVGEVLPVATTTESYAFQATLGDAATAAMIINFENSGDTMNYGILFRNGTKVNTAGVSMDAGGTGLFLRLRDSGGVNTLFSVDKNGGISTNASGATIALNLSADQGIIRLKNGTRTYDLQAVSSGDYVRLLSGSVGDVVRFYGTSQAVEAQANLYVPNGSVGIGTSSPTHALTLATASTGVAMYNTADQTTNYERGVFEWASNVFTIKTDKGGTGTIRNLRLRTETSGRNFILADAASSSGFYQFPASTSTANAVGAAFSSGASWGASSGVNPIVSIAPTIAQSSTAGYSALHINPTESSTGSGAKRLISAQVGGGDKFVVDADVAALEKALA